MHRDFVVCRCLCQKPEAVGFGRYLGIFRSTLARRNRPSSVYQKPCLVKIPIPTALDAVSSYRCTKHAVHLHPEVVHFLLPETPASPAGEVVPETKIIPLPGLPGQVVHHPQQAQGFYQGQFGPVKGREGFIAFKGCVQFPAAVCRCTLAGASRDPASQDHSSCRQSLWPEDLLPACPGHFRGGSRHAGVCSGELLLQRQNPQDLRPVQGRGPWLSWASLSITPPSSSSVAYMRKQARADHRPVPARTAKAHQMHPACQCAHPGQIGRAVCIKGPAAPLGVQRKSYGSLLIPSSMTSSCRVSPSASARGATTGISAAASSVAKRCSSRMASKCQRPGR
jgi:hypothetical protein